MRRLVPVLVLLFGVFSLFAVNLQHAQVAHADTQTTVNFQARLQTAAGGIVPDGNYNVEFKLYNASTGGAALWTEDRYNSSSTGLKVVNGYLSVGLGSVTAFPTTINWDQQLWLTMNIGGTSTGSPTLDGEMNPRLKLTAVPYAFSAGKLSQYNSTTGYTSTLSLIQPASGNQNFQIPDQGSTGTYSLLTTSAANVGYLQLQGSTPGTAQTGNFNISGTGTAATLNASTAIQTGGTTRIDATGNLTNIGNINGNGTLSLTGTGNSYLMGALGLGTSNPQSGSAITITNSSWISAVAAGGSGYINLFRVNSSNQIDVGAALNIDGYIVLPSDGGQLTFSDLPISSSTAQGTAESYTMRVGSTNALTVYGESDGAGGAQNVRVSIGSSIAPAYTLDVTGDANISTGSVYRINGTQICSATGCAAASGSTNYIQNSSSPQSSSNFNISGTGIASTLQAATLNIGSTAGAGSLLMNNGATVNATLALGNFASGGSIGTAAATVDVYTSISVAQTTASQTLTLPSPTAITTYGRMLYVSNVGTALFTMLGTPLKPGATASLIWSNTSGGASWQYAGADGNSILNQSGSAQSANFNIIAPSGVAATIQGAASTDIAQFITNGGAVAAKIDQLGKLTANGAAISAGSGSASVTSLSTTISNTNSSASPNTANGVSISASGTANTLGTNTTTALNIGSVTVNTGNTFYGINIGTGYSDILRYNGAQIISGTGILQSAGLSGSYANSLQLTNTANTYAGTSATLSGALSSGSISTNGLTVAGVLNQSSSNGGATYTQNTINLTNTNTTATQSVINAQAIGLTGTANTNAGGNVLVGTRYGNVTAQTNNVFYGISFGTGYTDILRYNGTQIINGTGILQSAGLSGSYVNALQLSNTTNTYAGATAVLSTSLTAPTISGVDGTQFTIGSTTNSSALVLQTANAGSITLNSNTISFNIRGTNVGGIDTNGRWIIKPTTDTVGSFAIQTSTGTNVFSVDTSATTVNVAGILNIASGGSIVSNGAITLQSSSVSNFTTPGGSTVGTKINIPIYTPGGFAQLIALGLPSAAPTTSRAISLFDARTSAHQPTISVFSPNESQVLGLSYDGSNTIGYLKNTAASIGLMANDLNVLTASNVSGAAQVTTTGLLQGATINATTALQTNGTTRIDSSGNANVANLSTSGTILFASSNSTIGFQVKGAGNVSLITVDTTNNIITFGNGSNLITIASSGEMSFSGTARHAKSISLKPTYSGVVVDPTSDASCSSNSNGTLTNGYATGITGFGNTTQSYYKWTTSQATSQCSDLIVQVGVPSDFSAWSSSTPITLNTYGATASTNTLNLEVRDATGTVESSCNFADVSPTTNNTWAAKGSACTLSGSYSVDSTMTLRIRISSPTGGDIRIGNLTLNYLSKF